MGYRWKLINRRTGLKAIRKPFKSRGLCSSENRSNMTYRTYTGMGFRQ
jgi:hypothetical protein